MTVKSLQVKKSNRNRLALNCLKKIGYQLPEIRQALVALNGLKRSSLNFTPAIITMTLSGQRHAGPVTVKVQSAIAKALGLELAELFPPTKKGAACQKTS